MIVCNGLVGMCILFCGLRIREQDVQVTGSSLYLSVLIVLATITLILPNYTLTTSGPTYSAGQLGFVSVVTVLLYGVFLYTQTILHRNYFIGDAGGNANDGPHTPNRMLAVSIALLLLSLLAVGLPAKKFSPRVGFAPPSMRRPPGFVAVLVGPFIL